MSAYSERNDGFEAGLAAKERAGFITDEHLEFLDELRESGVTNMFAALPYIVEAFDDLSDEEASHILSYWMKTFGERLKQPE